MESMRSKDIDDTVETRHFSGLHPPTTVLGDFPSLDFELIVLFTVPLNNKVTSIFMRKVYVKCISQIIYTCIYVYPNKNI